MTDLEIAQKAQLKPILTLAKEELGLTDEVLEPYGRFKAKIGSAVLKTPSQATKGRLILVSAMSPTPAGEGKTTTTIGLGDALRRLGKRAIICLREPSLGPVFGMKGGAAGGGRSQVAPMAEINLHFTGDFAAIALAHNLLSALIDNHLHHGNELKIDINRIVWRRVMDLNDRVLRSITIGLGGAKNGPAREDGFDIVVASEVMAIFCLAESLKDLERRLGEIIVAFNLSGEAVRARDLKATGAMSALLKAAWQPNLVQSLENTPAIVHGGPFANIAHGCNSLIATQTALTLGDYVVTEAGFGADLGAEKFIDIKCRQSGLRPAAAVVVATIRALKYHGGVEVKELAALNSLAIEAGFKNLERHVLNLRDVFKLPCVIAINQFESDSNEEILKVQELAQKIGVPVELATHWRDGGAGATRLAERVLNLIETNSTSMKFAYDIALPLVQKVEALASKIYRTSAVLFAEKALAQIKHFEQMGFGHLPVCIAKTPYSFSSDATARGAPLGHKLEVREARLAAGAGFVVCICGDIMTMPGLPKSPASEKIGLDEHGEIYGLS